MNTKLTPCQELGYKVGDKFEVLKSVCGFTKGRTITLYRDDGSDCPLFEGENSNHATCDGAEGAYMSLEDVKPLKEKEMFFLKTNPWYIRVTNEAEYNAANDWLEENFGRKVTVCYGGDYVVGLTNTNDIGDIHNIIMWMDESSIDSTPRHEIKLTFKTVVDSVEYPAVKSTEEIEREKKIKELKETIALAQKQLDELN